MSQLLFEQYKDALRRGHVAAQHGQLSSAIAAYESAATMAPDRALPHVSRGQVLVRLGRLEDAERAFSAALSRSPSDEPALRGRAQARIELRRPVDAARDHDVLAEVLERDGRAVDACDAVCAALALAESRERRASAVRLVARLQGLADDPRAEVAVRRARQLLDPGTSSAGSDGGTAGRATDPEAPSAPVPLDPAADLIEAFVRLEAGDFPAARARFLSLAAAERRSGRLDAALDASLILVAIDPADSKVQLEIAANHMARGWRDLASEKVRLLARLASLEADEAATAAIEAFATEHGIAPGAGRLTPEIQLGG
ncbi:MAG: tetratricopeptide repeat protein [Chloroflexota bacterium]